MTEEEAKNTICPKFWGCAVIGSTLAAISRPFDSQEEKEKIVIDYIEKSVRCKASDCMWWLWEKDCVSQTKSGHCGAIK